MSTNINVQCTDQRLRITDQPLIASGGVNEDVVNFTFDSSWDGFTKTAVFYQTEDAVYHMLVVNDSCSIPHEVLAEPGYLLFGVFGVNGDVIKTSEVLKYKIERGAITTATLIPDPTPDIYQQILGILATKANAEGDFELVNNITLDTATARLYLTQTDDGDVYDFAKMYVQIVIPAAGLAAQLAHVLFNYPTVGVYPQISENDVYSNFIYVFAEIIGGRVHIEHRKARGAESNRDTIADPPAALLGNAASALNRLQINLGSGGNLPTGTTVKVYGIWSV